MANDGDGNGHSPHKCACCDEDIGEDDNVLTCELCSFRFIKTTCVGMSAKIACGSIQWKCPECSKISTANLLQQIMSKLSKIDEIGKDVEMLKSQNRNASVPECPLADQAEGGGSRVDLGRRC